jgi:hypothetical protein
MDKMIPWTVRVQFPTDAIASRILKKMHTDLKTTETSPL